MTQLSQDQFKEKVLEKLRQYAGDKTEEELQEAMSEYDDLVQEGYSHHRGQEYGCDYAAWNISQCI